MNKQEFFNNYQTVFDNMGNIKPCGRETVITLIKSADELDPEISHGNIITGMMDEKRIKNLYTKYESGCLYE